MADDDQQQPDPTPARPPAPGGRNGPPPPPPTQVTLGQQLIIAGLVIAVGVLFGMAPSLGLLQQGARPPLIEDVSNDAALMYQETAERLQRVLNPEPDPYSRGPMFVERDLRAYAQRLWLADRAEEEGLMPTGSLLDRIVDTWLRTTLDDGRTYATALAEHQRGRNAVSREQLARFLQVQTANRALQRRHLMTPPAITREAVALARAGVDDYRRAYQLGLFPPPPGDRLQLAEVELSSARLADAHLEAISADDDRLLLAYEDLRERFFRLPETVTLTCFVADGQAIGERLAFPAEELAARYQATPERWTTIETTGPATASEPATRAVTRSLEDVTAELEIELAGEAGPPLARTLIDRFQQALIAAGMTSAAEADPAKVRELAATTNLTSADDPRISAPIAIEVVKGVVVTRPDSGTTLDIGDFGTVDNKDVKLFGYGKEVGSLVNRYEDPTKAGRYVLLQLEDRAESGYQPLQEVRDEVARREAAREAYDELLTTARELAERANRIGSLARLWDPTLAERWQATVTNRPVPTLTPVADPAEGVDLPTGAPRPVLDLDRPGRPTFVLAATAGPGDAVADDVPRLRLVQVVGHEPAPVSDQDQVQRLLRASRMAVSAYLSGRHFERLQRRMQDG